MSRSQKDVAQVSAEAEPADEPTTNERAYLQADPADREQKDQQRRKAEAAAAREEAIRERLRTVAELRAHLHKDYPGLAWEAAFEAICSFQLENSNDAGNDKDVKKR
jgi:hypothetical protein